MDVKRQNEKLKEEIAELKQKLSLLENKASQASQSSADDQARLQKIFATFDRDRDGALSGPELQDLALQLGEHIPASEVAACLSEIAPAGKLDFDAFHRWWRTPQEYHREDPGNKKLRALRLKLQTRPLFDLMARVCAAPSFEPARLPKWPAPRGPDTAKVDVTVNTGLFDTVAASVRVQLINEPERMNKIRADLGVSPRACVIGGAFILQPEVNDNRLRQLKEFISQMLEENRKETTYTSFQLKEGRTETGQRLLWIYIIFENRREINVIQEVIETIDFKALDVNLGLSQKPGDPNNGFIKARLSVQAEASRTGLEWLVAKIAHNDRPPMRRVFNLLNGITGVAVRLDATDLTHVFPKIAKGEPINAFQGWASIPALLLMLAASENANEETMNVYSLGTSVLAAPHVAYVLLEDKMVQAAFDNLFLTEVMPTAAQFAEARRAAEEGEEDDDAPAKKPAGRRQAPRGGAAIDSDSSGSEDEELGGGGRGGGRKAGPYDMI